VTTAAEKSCAAEETAGHKLRKAARRAPAAVAQGERDYCEVAMLTEIVAAWMLVNVVE
jgi:hypothetical protein